MRIIGRCGTTQLDCSYRGGDSSCSSPSRGSCPYYVPGIERPVESRTERDDRDRMFEFGKAMYRKWQKGRATYGTEYKIDPLAEAMDECLDIANYSMETYFRIKKLKEKLGENKNSNKG
jgi:hypothetical protein